MVCQTYPVLVIEFMLSLYLQVLFVSYVGAIIVVEPILELVHKWASMFSLLWVLLKCVLYLFLIDCWSFSLSTVSLPVTLIELGVSLTGGGFSKVCLIPWTTKSRDWCSALREIFCSFFIRPKFDHCLDLAHRYDVFLSSVDVEIKHSNKHDHLK